MGDEKIQQPPRVQETKPSPGETSERDEDLLGLQTYEILKPDRGCVLAIAWRITAGFFFHVLVGVFAINLAPGIPPFLALAFLLGTFVPCVVAILVAHPLYPRPKRD